MKRLENIAFHLIPSSGINNSPDPARATEIPERFSKHANYKLLAEHAGKQSLKGKTLFITGASRGIGLAIALEAAKQGANIAIVAKTAEEDKRLPGTIYTAAEEIKKAGGKALPLKVDIRSEEQVAAAVAATVKEFGGIDVLINNASAISLTPTTETSMKKFDLMNQINARGTFLVSKYCIPHLKKSQNGHILNMSPPLNMEEKWFAPHVAYTIAKYNMSLYALGMAGELRSSGIAVNTLWPLTVIATAAVKNILGGDDLMNKGRTVQIMADSAVAIITSDSRKVSGNFFVDEPLLQALGVTDFSKYAVVPGTKREDLVEDFFV